MLDYKLLEALAAVVSETTFEKAANKLFITQSAISQRIKLLEEQTGQILLDRSSPPKPTLAGLEFLVHFNKVSHLEQELVFRGKEEIDSKFHTISFAINSDTLGTWLFHIIQPYLQSNNLILNLSTEDQDQTHQLLRDGTALACIGTYNKPIQGCNCTYLGDVSYGFYCNEAFYEEWFKDGFTKEKAIIAPTLKFNKKDELNNKLFKKMFGNNIETTNTHFIPSSELFPDLLVSGLGYGALPEHQSVKLVEEKKLIDLTGHNSISEKLYYHCWNLKSDVLNEFSKYFIKTTQAFLN